jgi:uncharacterized protein (DUF2062 family)/SAM-dependent methyltransferase
MMRPPSMPDVPDATSPVPRHRAISGLRRLVHGLRTEGGTPRQEIAAIAIGVFIGCLPFYGFHLLLCLAVGWLLGLNRVKMYLAANVSNPFVAPWLLFAELQAGSWLRRGTFHEVTLEHIKSTGVAVLTVDLLVGSLAIGVALAALAAWGTQLTLRGSSGDRFFVDLVRSAADPYAGISITAWEFARGKLRNDPVYRAAIERGLLERHAPEAADVSQAPTAAPRALVDIGCGQGLMLALLVDVRRRVRAGTWTQAFEPPVFARIIGIEHRARVAGIAAAALAGEAEILSADARHEPLQPADCVLLFDVLHLMPADDQRRLLSSCAAALQPGGVIVVREADASAGWRFTAVRVGNRLKALAVGKWRQTFHFRTASAWRVCFDELGLEAEMRPMGQGTPFGNVLFRVHRRHAAGRDLIQ